MALLVIRLIYRGGLFCLALLVPEWLDAGFGPWSGFNLVNVIWASYFCCIVFKLIPVRRSLGRNKIMPKYYDAPVPPVSAERANQVRRDQNRGALRVAAVWAGLNAVVFALYFAGPLTAEHMVVISLFYFTADLVCILFFCPFQVFLMKNRCCVSCRIYSWDALMMVTPLLVLNSAISWSLVAAATVVIVRWEVAFARHPERFSHVTNARLQCAGCTEKSCRIKKPGGLGLVSRKPAAGKTASRTQ